MQSRLNAYLNFKGQAREALEFYHSALGGTIVMNTYGEAQATQDPSESELIMHGMLETPNNMFLMVSDLPATMEYRPGKNISLSLSGDNETELRGYWEKLSVGATINEPLVQAPWGDTFGMLTDKFGIDWMINIAPAT